MGFMCFIATVTILSFLVFPGFLSFLDNLHNPSHHDAIFARWLLQRQQINIEWFTYCVFLSVATDSDFCSRWQRVHKIADGDWRCVWITGVDSEYVVAFTHCHGTVAGYVLCITLLCANVHLHNRSNTSINEQFQDSGKGKSFPILVTERWARSWSRCTGSQPAGDVKWITP